MRRRLLQRIFRSREPTTPAADPAPPPRRDWASLPPLRTAAGRRPAEVSGITRFASEVVSQNRPALQLAPLGHDLAPEAPRGIVTGIARAAASPASRAPEMPFARRLTRRRRRAVMRWPESTSPSQLVPRVDEDRPAQFPGGDQTPEVVPAAAVMPAVGVDNAPEEDDHASATVPEVVGIEADRATPAHPPGAEPRPLAHATVRRARATVQQRPAAAPSAPAPRPPGMTFRPLAVQRSVETPQSTSPTTAERAKADGGVPTSAPGTASPSVGEREVHDRQVASPPSMPVRPTAGAEPIISRSAEPGDHEEPVATTRPPVRRTGLGPPLESLPPTASAAAHPTRPRDRSGADAVPAGVMETFAPAPQSLGDSQQHGQPDRHRDVPAPAHPSPSQRPVVARRVASSIPGDRPPLGPNRSLVGARSRLVVPSPGPGRGTDGVASQQDRYFAPVALRWETNGHEPSPHSPGPIAPRSGEPSRPADTLAPRISRQTRSADPAPALGTPSYTGDLPSSFAGHPLVERLVSSRPSVDPRPLARPQTSSEATQISRHTDGSITPAADSVGRPVVQAAAHAPVQRRVEFGAATTEPAASSVEIGPVTTDVEEEPEIDMNAVFAELYPRVRDELRWELRVQRERAGLLSDPL